MYQETNPTCPLCGMWHQEPRPHHGSTTWSDGCCCSDRGRCVAHQICPQEGPSRPSTEEMQVRAEAKAAREHTKWEALMKRFDDYREWASGHYPEIPTT